MGARESSLRRQLLDLSAARANSSGFTTLGLPSPLIAQLHLAVAVAIGPGAVEFAGAEPVGPSDLVGCFLYVRDGR
jgi:hypothetical protein